MVDTTELLAPTDVPDARPRETLDARELPPPQPLQNTLERLPELHEETVLVQLNDRAPQHLFPKLSERGYRYETVEGDGCVVTAIWRDETGS